MKLTTGLSSLSSHCLFRVGHQAGTGRRETLRLRLVTLTLLSETHLFLQALEYVPREEVQPRRMPSRMPSRTRPGQQPSIAGCSQGLIQQQVTAPDGLCPMHPNQTGFRPSKSTPQNGPWRLTAWLQTDLSSCAPNSTIRNHCKVKTTQMSSNSR